MRNFIDRLFISTLYANLTQFTPPKEPSVR
jgi:hypothetical protein